MPVREMLRGRKEEKGGRRKEVGQRGDATRSIRILSRFMNEYAR